MTSHFERVPNPSGRGVTYYVHVYDTDSRMPIGCAAWVKAWDTEEIPDWMMAGLLHDWLRSKVAGVLRAVFSIPHPPVPRPPKPKI